VDAVCGELREPVLGCSPSALNSDRRSHDGEWSLAEAPDGLCLVEEAWQLREVRLVGSYLTGRGGEGSGGTACPGRQPRSGEASEGDTCDAGPRERREESRAASPHRVEAGIVRKIELVRRRRVEQGETGYVLGVLRGVQQRIDAADGMPGEHVRTGTCAAASRPCTSDESCRPSRATAPPLHPSPALSNVHTRVDDETVRWIHAQLGVRSPCPLKRTTVGAPSPTRFR